MLQTNCRFFNGYKPCGKSSSCSADCPSKNIIKNSILIIHLGAIGAVLRSTTLLGNIRSKYPQAMITWITDAPADQLLRGHLSIDRILSSSSENILFLKALRFDAAFVIDKSLKASAILKSTNTKKVFGFQADPRSGAIHPATSAAQELWEIGLDDQRKFFQNTKSEVQLMLEALELEKPQANRAEQVPDYDLSLTTQEKLAAQKRHDQWRLNPHQPVIGINTGCSAVIPPKKLSVNFQREIIQDLLHSGFENIVLLGGPEDSERNARIGQGLPVFQSPTNLGLRDGLVSVAACDLVLTGDSLGMHMAISQKKFVIAWFGPTCAQEIELYGRGVSIQTKAPCAPCWKRSCEQTKMCYDQVSLSEIRSAIEQGQDWWRQQNEFSLSKPLF
jgi:heptosyltransferase-2